MKRKRLPKTQQWDTEIGKLSMKDEGRKTLKTRKEYENG
jgi:hypothetical protein